MQRSFLYLSRVITSYNPGQNCWDISMQFSISHHAIFVSKRNKFAPLSLLVQCCFGLTAQVCISCVIVNNIAKGEGGNGLLICDGKHFCQGEWKKCNVSQQVLSEVVYRCFSAFFNCDINYHESLSFVKEKCMKLIVFEHFSFLWND